MTEEQTPSDSDGIAVAAEESPTGTPKGTDWLALGAALVTVVLWASAFVGIRAAGEEL